MIEFKKKPPRAILLVVLAVILGLGGGLILAWVWPDGREEPGEEAAPPQCLLGEEPAAALAECREGLESVREDLNAIQLQVAELRELVEARGNSSVDLGLRASLPPPYVAKVDSFFETDVARNLLSAKAQSARSVRFEIPLFLDQDLLTVPYIVADQEYFLIVNIEILEYYHLKFDVIWDSMEGEGR